MKSLEFGGKFLGTKHSRSGADAARVVCAAHLTERPEDRGVREVETGRSQLHPLGRAGEIPTASSWEGGGQSAACRGGIVAWSQPEGRGRVSRGRPESARQAFVATFFYTAVQTEESSCSSHERIY